MSRRIKRLSARQLRKLILKETKVSRRTRSHGPSLGTLTKIYEKKIDRFSLADMLFEAELAPEEIAAAAPEGGEVSSPTMIVLYGPPAAGKGAGKADVATAVAKSGGKTDQSYKDFWDPKGASDEEKATLKQMAGDYETEEDAYMVKLTTETLPPLVFKDLYQTVAGEDGADAQKTKFEELMTSKDFGPEGGFFHVNEDGNPFPMPLSYDAFLKILGIEAGTDVNDGDYANAEKSFTGDNSVKTYFTQARGFAREVPGFPKAPKGQKYLGDTGDGKTLGIRTAAISEFMKSVQDEMGTMMDAESDSSPYKNIYIADQAGESSANTDRIKAIGDLKKSGEVPGLKVVGVYVHQPMERTVLANMHRMGLGGSRQVNAKDMMNIFNKGPSVPGDASVGFSPDPDGDIIDAMQTAGYDEVYIFTPPGGGIKLDDTSMGSIGSAICEPFGAGKGALDVKGCSPGDMDKFGAAGDKIKAIAGGVTGTGVDYRSMGAVEKRAADIAFGDDKEEKVEKGGTWPEDMSDDDLEKLAATMNDKMGFSGLSVGDLKTYMTKYKPPNARGASKHGVAPYGDDLGFTTDAGKPSIKSKNLSDTGTKKESARTTPKDNLIMERWRKLAGLI